MLNDSLPGGMFGCYWEDGLPVYFINGMMLDVLGYDGEADFISDVDGLMANGIHPDDRAAVLEALDRQLSGNFQYSLEYRIRKKNKSYIWVQDIGRLVKAENGRDVLVSVCMDITDEKKRLQMERELYDREMAYFSGNSVEIQGRINVTRGRVERYFHTEDVSISHDGDSFKQMVIKLADTAVEPSYREKLLSELSRKNLLNNFRSGKQEYQFEFLRKKNNGMFWAHMDFRLYLNPDTQDVMMFFYTKNVTEQKVRDYTFDFIAKMDYDLICDVDMVRGNYQMLSRRAENGTTLPDSGVFQDEIRQKTCRLMDEETSRRYLECMDFDNIRNQLEGRKVYSFVLQMNDTNGSFRTKKYQIFYINEPLQRVGITRTDVTDIAQEKIAGL
ncbi:MAG: PAS domain-containing protein [Lachnospiraceae bacterium]|nr:PAS domain-containing protein [Lachnospiraceae bacterium]